MKFGTFSNVPNIKCALRHFWYFRVEVPLKKYKLLLSLCFIECLGSRKMFILFVSPIF